jgi:hypothetical protein
MQHLNDPQRNRRSHRSRKARISPYLLDEIAFTRADIERARAGDPPAT